MRLLLVLLILVVLAACAKQIVYVIPPDFGQGAIAPQIEMPQEYPPQPLPSDFEEDLEFDPCEKNPSIPKYEGDDIKYRKRAAYQFAYRIGCLLEEKRYKEFYEELTHRLRQRRSLKAFLAIIEHRKVEDLMPYSMEVYDIRFFDNAHVAHISYLSDYKTRRLGHERRRDPRQTIRWIDGRWWFDGLEEIFGNECSRHSDCVTPSECTEKCAKKGLLTKTMCDPILQECSCYCFDPKEQTGEITFYDLTI